MSFKMILFCVVLFVNCVHSLNGNITVDSSETETITESNSKESVTVHSVYHYDPQINGLNSSTITSGPIIFGNKKNIFISNVQYNGLGNALIFCVGVGSHNTEKQCITERYLTANHTNINIDLPDNITLDTIDFLEVAEKNSPEPLDLVTLENVNRSAIRPFHETSTEDIIYRFPKCCKENQYHGMDKWCIDAQKDIIFDIKIFESNETGLDPDVRLNVSENELRPFYQSLECKDDEIRLDVGDTKHGLIYNSSLIIEGNGILSHGEFCIDLIEDGGKLKTSTAFCYRPEIESSDPNIYLPVLIVSTICLFISAAAYGIILKRGDIWKRSFIAFSTTMGLTCLFLIILQVQNDKITCNIFGFGFLFLIVLSHAWLFIFGFELAYLVKFPLNNDRNPDRWKWFLWCSVGFSFLILLVSIFAGGFNPPGVPYSFIKNYDNTRCRFETSMSRACIIFVPMALFMVLSILAVLCFTIFVKNNDKIPDINNHCDWIMNKNSYNFLCRTYLVILVASLFWLSNAVYYFFEGEKTKTQLGLEVMEAIIGIVTMVTFVLNKYTLAEIKEKLTKETPQVTEEEIGLNGIQTPDSPLGMEDPFIEQDRNIQLTTFSNNRSTNNRNN